jgi:NUMOD4 motif
VTDDASERWRPVRDYEGLYEVSDRGQVRSLDRQVVVEMPGGYKIASGRTVRTYRGKTLKWWIGTDGYPQVTLSRGGVQTHVRVHILVLEAFTGPCPPGQEARHGPAGRSDPGLSNLRGWGTRIENLDDRVTDGKGNRGERHGLAKRTAAVILEIRARVAAGERQIDVARDLDLDPKYIRLVVHRKCWQHV